MAYFLGKVYACVLFTQCVPKGPLCIIKDDVKDLTDGNVYEPFEEFVKQVGNRSQSETINELRG